jgi:hypothetical protein
MDITEVWRANLRAIVDAIAPGDPKKRGVKREGYREVASRTRKNVEFVYQAYTGVRGIGPDFASALDREFSNGRPPGWINTPPDEAAGASDEPSKLDHSRKVEGLGLNEFLNYLNALYPQAPLTPEEVIEEAEAYREFASKRVANRILKQKFNAPNPVSDARVEQAFGSAPRSVDSPAPDQQLVESPLARPGQRSAVKKKGTS